MKDIVILGASGHGREILDLIESLNTERRQYNLIGFVDDNVDLKNSLGLDVPILGDRGWLLDRKRGGTLLALGLGSPRSRLAASRWSAKNALTVPSLIHPSASISARATIGESVVIMANSWISVGATIGAFSLINIGCTVAHDCTLGDFATLAPGVQLAGGVSLDEGAELGIGAVAIPQSRLGSWSMTGAGAVVRGEVAANAIVAGVPARVLRTREQGWQET